MMLLGLFGLSAFADSSAVAISGFMVLLGGGFALVNTPIAAAVSLTVDPQLLASALSLNSMLLFIGGSFGAALVIALSSGDPSAINPLHTGAAAGYSNAFLAAGLFVIVALGLSFAVPSQAGEPAKEEVTPEELGPLGVEWVADCSIPWTPECSRAEHAEVLTAS